MVLILLWQILYMIGVDGFGIWKSLCDAVTKWCVEIAFTEMIKTGTVAIG